jgi:hypothetical protein
MNTKPSPSRNTSHDGRIDAALAHFAHAAPPPGLESRVTARLAAADRLGVRSQSLRYDGSVRFLVLRRLSVGAMATAAGVAIVFGTVEHSRRILPPVTAGRPVPSGRVSTAGAVHIPTHAIPQSAQINPKAPRTAPHGRAVVSPNHGRHAPGAAVPRSPYPPEAQPTSSSDQQQ